MIQRKRINNDVFIRWGVTTPDGATVDLSRASSISIEARPQSSNSRYPLTHRVVGNFVEAYFLAKDQRITGIYNLYLSYTVNDNTVSGGVATYTLDYCGAFELVPKSCILIDEDIDPVNVQGTIASITYSMLTEAEKNDLASRLSGGGTGGGGATRLTELTDVAISSLANGHVLTYNGTHWVNKAPSNTGGTQVSWTGEGSQYATLKVGTAAEKSLSLYGHSHNWSEIVAKPVTDTQLSHLVQLATLWQIDANGNLFTEKNVYSKGEITAYSTGGSSGGSTGPGATSLNELSDVTLNSPQNGHILQFNGTHWVNKSINDLLTHIQWGTNTSDYVNLTIGGTGFSLSRLGHKHAISDITNLQATLNTKENTIPVGTTSQYYRGDKTWAALTTSIVTEGTNLYYTNARVKTYADTLYALKSHTHPFSDLTNLPSTLAGHGITDAYTKSEVNDLLSSGGTGTFWVSSVGLSAPTGFVVSGSPITSTGTLSLSFAAGYSLPTTTKQNEWNAAYENIHTHSNKGVLDGLTSSLVTNWNAAYTHSNATGNPHRTKFSEITEKPTTIVGYGITNAYTKTEVDNLISGTGSGTLSSVGVSVPTGFTVTNSPLTSNGVINITYAEGYSLPNITSQNNWNTAFSWGPHAGLYMREDLFNAHIDNEDPYKQHVESEQLAHLIKLMEWWKLDENGNLFTELNVYSTGEISAYGAGSGGSSGGAGSMGELADVALTSLTSDQLLMYNGTHWVNVPKTAVGTVASWGTTSNNTSPLSIAGTTKTVSLSTHTHTTDNITSGVFPVARLGTGTASSSTFLRGDGTWATPTSTTYTGSTSIILSGTSFQRAALTGDVTSPQNSNVLTLASSGVTAGTYRSVTVDAKGRVTAGTNPTTIATYGLTDAASITPNSPYAYLGATYIANGLEKPNYFGSGKLKLQMLQSGSGNLNLAGFGSWSDVLWMSSYTGSDVKGSNALVISKSADRIGIIRSNYDATTWGTFYELLTTSNYTATMDSRYVTLNTAQTITATKTFSTPFAITSPTLISNLNAEYLNGLDYYKFARGTLKGYLSGTVKGWKRVAVVNGTSSAYVISGTLIIGNVYSTSWNVSCGVGFSVSYGALTEYQNHNYVDLTKLWGSKMEWFPLIRLVVGKNASTTSPSVSIEVYYDGPTSGSNWIEVHLIGNSNRITLLDTWEDVAVSIPTDYVSKQLNLNYRNGITTDNITASYGYFTTLSGTNITGYLNGTAAMANALQTARTLWGQSFNGKADVSGALTGVSTISLTGAITPAASNYRSAGIYGVYDSTKASHIWSIGTNYKMADDGLSFGNMYGLAYKYNNVISNTNLGSAQHEIVGVHNGTVYFELGLSGSAWFANVVKSLRLETHSTVTEAHLLFRRPDYNYIYAVAGGSIAFIPNAGTIGDAGATMVVHKNGNVRVGITTTAPATTLDVTGTIRATGEITAHTASDYRLKSEIKPLNSLLEVVGKLNPVQFKWNDEAFKLNPVKSKGIEYGLIAQEVKEILPDIVHNVYDEYLGLDYVKLIPVLIGAIKELKKEVESLKN